jgi:uncharacterized protein with HEPN domain
MPRDYRLYLDDIRQSIDLIRRYVKGMPFEEFQTDQKTIDAVVRNLEIIGEASGHLPNHLRALASDVEWRKIVALRNLLIHEYFGISIRIVWDIVQNKLQPLEDFCSEVLERDEGQT